MTTIATQTDEVLSALFRFRDVAEDTCSAEAVTDALMSQIEDRDNRIKRLEITLEGFYKAGEYVQQRHQAYGYEEPPGNPDALRERIGDVFDEYEEMERVEEQQAAEIESLEDEKYDLEERVEELEEEGVELKSDYAAAKCVISMKKDENEVNKKNMFKFMKENKELREKIKTMLCQ